MAEEAPSSPVKPLVELLRACYGVFEEFGDEKSNDPVRCQLARMRRRLGPLLVCFLSPWDGGDSFLDVWRSRSLSDRRHLISVIQSRAEMLHIGMCFTSYSERFCYLKVDGLIKGLVLPRDNIEGDSVTRLNLVVTRYHGIVWQIAQQDEIKEVRDVLEDPNIGIIALDDKVYLRMLYKILDDWVITIPGYSCRCQGRT